MNISKVFSEAASKSPSQFPGSYVYSILPIEGERLAALTSGDELLFLDKSGLEIVSRHQDDVPKLVSCMAGCEDERNIVVCAGGDGLVATFDIRADKQVSQFHIDRAVTALAYHNYEVAVGSEVAHSQATVSVWDIRQNQMRWQSSENHDDITALQYHPSDNHMLLSGGDDGLVGVFDTTIQDDNESLIQAFNHGPIHKAGFLSNTAIYALSADQQFSIHPVSNPGADDADVVQAILFGDVRPAAQCDYVIDVLQDPHQPCLAVGSHLSDPHIDLIPLVANPTFAFSKLNVVRVQKAHSEEIVRSVYVDKSAEAIFTAGEDGCVKSFRIMDQAVESAGQRESSVKESKKGKGGRFRPY